MAQGRGNAIVFALAVLSLLQIVAAKDYTVGDSTGWNIAPTADYYNSWASKITFAPGDNLIFNYLEGQHDVQIVTSAQYASCANSDGKRYVTGKDIVPLPKAGDYYFLCSYVGHCDQGMKMKISVKAAATPPATPVKPPTPPPVKAPAPAPVVKAPTPAPVPVPVSSPAFSPAPVPEFAPTFGPVVAPLPETPLASAPAPIDSSGHSVQVCFSFFAAALVATCAVLLM